MPRRRSHIAPCTVLFTDMVASTQHAAARGDERWRAVLHRFDGITTQLTERFGGTVVKSTGDGHLATFDGPTQAIRCAEALRADAETLGIEIRAGIHTGECELLETDIGGLAVHIAARILGHAEAGESWSRAPCVTWWSARARASRTADPSSCAACPAPGSCWRSIATARGPDRRGATGVNAHPRPADRDAPLGPRRGDDGEAHTVDPARDGPPSPGHRG